MSHVKNIAIVGATGSVGKFIVDELLKAGKHQVTAITRNDSKATIPDGVKIAKVNYDDKSTLVAALKGQEVLIITLAPTAPKDTQTKLIDGAAEAGVPWILPNEWGYDSDNDAVVNDIMGSNPYAVVRKYIERAGLSWIGVASGFWYEFSLGGGPDRYGFDFVNRSLTLIDDGKTPIDTTTWPKSGLAVARLLALPIKREGSGDNGPALEDFRNKFLYVSSFRISQQDMFESVLRVTKTKREDWTVTNENYKERFEGAVKAMRGGDSKGFMRTMYTRIFCPDGSGIYDSAKGPHNDLLGLPQEDLDESTKVATRMPEGTYKGVY